MKRTVAFVTLLIAVTLCGIGGYKANQEHEELSKLRGLQAIMQDLVHSTEKIANETGSSLGQTLAMSTANMAQSQVDQYQEIINTHETQEAVGYGLLAGGFVFFILSFVFFKKSARDRHPVFETSAAEVAVEHPTILHDDVEYIEAPHVIDSHNSWTTPAMAILAVIILVGLAVYFGPHETQPIVPTAQAVVSAPTPTQAPDEGDWQVDTDKNPVTGEITKTAYLKYKGKQNIYVRQKGKKLQCYITTDEFLETTDNLDSRNSIVQYKFDAGKVRRQIWSISDDNEGLFYPGTPKTFLAQMRHAKSLSIEYRPADKVPQTVTFDVTGFPDVFTK